MFNQQTRIDTTKILTPGVAKNTLKADDVKVNEWMNDWALTPVETKII